MAKNIFMTDLDDLRMFVFVATTMHFTEAAKVLGVHKASVSRAISRLERSLGRPLFFRTTQAVELTHAGNELYNRSRELFTQYEMLSQQLNTVMQQIAHIDANVSK